MTGQQLKQKLAEIGCSNINELAKIMGQSNQKLYASMASPDIKTGLIEDIARALGLRVSDFYAPSAKADNGIAVSGGSVDSPVVNNAISESLVQSMLDTKDKQIEKQGEQIDRLLGIIEKLK